MRILLMNLPFIEPYTANIGITILKDILKSNGLSVTLEYENVKFYTENKYSILFNWLFENQGYEDILPTFSSYFPFRNDVNSFHIPNSVIDILNVYIESLIGAYSWGDYDLVGFSIMNKQLNMAILLSFQLKKIYKNINIVFGGSLCDYPMNNVIIKYCNWINAIFTGYSEISFINYIMEMKINDKVTNTLVISQIGSTENNLNAYNELDYTDYINVCKTRGIDINKVRVLFETSRGCWKAEHSKCAFCGLNGNQRFYVQRENPEKDFLNFISEYKDLKVNIIDNIQSRDKPFIFLGNGNSEYDIFAELKIPSLKAEDLKSIKERGIKRLQVGIETLNNSTLRSIKKACSIFDIIYLLKVCKAEGIDVYWNYLTCFPGETYEQYYEVLKLIEKIYFLQPPRFVNRVRIDRYSDFHENRQKYNIGEIEPNDFFKKNFHYMNVDDLYNFAYSFNDSEENNYYNEKLHEMIRNKVNLWKKTYKESNLYYIVEEGNVVFDNRSMYCKTYYLSQFEFNLLDFLFCSRRLSEIKMQFRDYKDNEILMGLEKLESLDLIYVDGSRYIGLPLIRNQHNITN